MSFFSLPGPEFLRLWVPLGLAAVVVTLIIRRVIAGRGASESEIRSIADQLDPSEVAFLAGNTRRAVESAVSALLHVGAVRVVQGNLHSSRRPSDLTLSPDGVYRGIPRPSELSVTEAYVLDQIDRGFGVSVGALMHSARPLEVRLYRRMAHDRLLASRSRVARAILHAPGLLWLAMGASKLAIGLSRDRPIGILIMLLFGGVIALGTLRPPRLSARGAAVLRLLAARTHGLVATARSAPDQLTRPDLTLAYALAGAGAFATTAALTPSPARAESVGKGSGESGVGCGSCGGGGTSCGASCGGGGSCGGCGGCGGGA